MRGPRLEDSIEIGGCELPNRLYRAPLLECAGDGDDAVDALIRELEPAAASGVGLLFQGAAPVRAEGGRVAPNMTPVADPEFVAGLAPLTEAIHDHGSRIFLQLEHGGIRTMETWHRPYREANPDLEQLAVSPLPPLLRLAARAGFLEYDLRVLSTDEAYELARDFGRSAAYAVDAGYDGIHLSGANMGILQQFLSPFYNRRDDEFGDDVRFLELVHDEIRERVGSVPIMTKVPAESAAPPFVRPRLSVADGVRIATRLEEIGFDAVVPVRVSTFWDMSIVRGSHPGRAWNDSRFEPGYAEAFGGRLRAKLVETATRVESSLYPFEPGWNAGFCRRVRRELSIPVLAEGGIRTRAQMDRLLGESCDLVGMGRPFYAEPRLAARVLDDGGARAVCENCNNCTVPQVTGARGVCRTPEVLARKGELERRGAYERGE